MIAVQPAGVVFAALCEKELATALAAIQRTDSEALHDFRVALRRLHVLLKQLARHDKQRRKLLRRIKVLMVESTKGRDVQVMLEWLKGEWPHLNEQERDGAREWQRTLERILGQQQLLNQKQAISDLKGMVPTLGKLLPFDDKRQRPFGLLDAEVLEQQVSELSSLMKGGDSMRQLHLIRLKTKTVRYLILPFSNEMSESARAQEALQKMQTVLGDWHDGVMRQQSLVALLSKEVERFSRSKSVVGTVADRSPIVIGLIALTRSNHLAQQRLVTRIKRKYLLDGGTHLIELLQQAISEMRKSATVVS